MSQPKGSLGVALTIVVLIVIAVAGVGYYQFMYCTSANCSTQNTTTSAGGPSCTPPSCVTIVINPGAAALTTTAYTPDTARLVIGVNNTFQVFNNDSQSGGVAHTLTAKTCPQTCPFDTGVLAYNATKGPFTITTPGTYPYYCVIHPTTMVGTIVVVAGTGAGGGAPPPASTSSSSTTSKGSSAAATGLTVSIPKGSSSPSGAPGYSPTSITVVIGKNNTVTWSNDDTAPHTVTSASVPTGAPTFDSGIMQPSSTFSQTFTVPGTYQYVCTLHSWMKGTVIVKSG